MVKCTPGQGTSLTAKKVSLEGLSGVAMTNTESEVGVEVARMSGRSISHRIRTPFYFIVIAVAVYIR